MPVLSRHVKTPDSYNLDLPGRGTLQDKIYVGFVKTVPDIKAMGRLQVWIPELSGDPTDETGWFLVNYCSPFAGATNIYDSSNENTYAGTQKSYGMWFVPPDINNEVICAFINGDPGRGIWFGCLYQQNMDHMVPGIPGQNSTASLPVAEYNKKINQTNMLNPERPLYSPLSDALVKQGLDLDTVRGVSDSGARRTDPQMSVYGLLTPGGSQMVFDDNPANAFIRFRTQSGAQLLINDTSGCVYINSVDGKNWVSLDANGRVDIYGYDDISIRSQGSLNLRADRDVNIEAGQDINIKARGSVIATPVANPAAGAVPTPPTPGPTKIIGDEIGVAIASRLEGSVNLSNTDNATSSSTLSYLQSQPDANKDLTNAVVSIGTNDASPSFDKNLFVSNLQGIRDILKAPNFVWILPYSAEVKAAMLGFAITNSDKYIDLSTYPTSDAIHPRDYNLVANDVNEKCIPATTSSTANSTTTSSTVSTTTTSSTTSTTPTTLGSDAAAGTSYLDIVTPFLAKHEGKSNDAFWDPPNQRNLVSIGYGHQIQPAEYSAGGIDTGIAGKIAIRSSNPSASKPGCGTATDDQCTALLRLDIPKYAAQVQHYLRGSWDSLGPYQQAALTSLCYNTGPGGIVDLVNQGITTYISNKDLEGAAKLIETTRPGWKGNPTGLVGRRKDEANLYRQRPDLLGQGATGNIEGEALAGVGSAAAQGSIATEDPNISFGYIKMQSRNSMHLSAGQYMFMSSELDMHRFAGKNLNDTAGGNANRLIGGYMHESVNADYGITAGGNMAIIAPRVDINGVAPPIAIAAVAALGPNEQKQADAVLNTLGNSTPILTDTIVYHLPYHEPYDNHGGRNFESLRDSTNLDTNTGLRDGEVIINSTNPLDLIGTPRPDMPIAVYRGDSYNSQNQPIYRYEQSSGNVALQATSALEISTLGKQFIKARENGSYVVISTGNPLKKSVGYGHDLSPEEITQNTVQISGVPYTLTQPLTQQNIDSLFEDDIKKVQDWMKPVVNVAVTQTQYDMLCSLAFNIGQTNFTNSLAIKSINDGNLQKVPNQWMQHTVNGGGQVVPGLVIRRRSEVTKYMLAPFIENYPNNLANIANPGSSTIQVTPTH